MQEQKIPLWYSIFKPVSLPDFQIGNDSCARIGTLAMSAPEKEVSGANALASSQLRVPKDSPVDVDNLGINSYKVAQLI